MYQLFISLLLALGSMRACSVPSVAPTDEKRQEAFEDKVDPFADYWYSGLAEISTYHVSQSRYGEMREATAVILFVTEDFDPESQVKLDDVAVAPNGKTPVLKCNKQLRFPTGIYDYSLMESVFTPINSEERVPSMKVTSTIQDWCGQTFTQLNHKDGKYEIRQFSYFEKEGDMKTSVKTELIEDELWNLIRLSPNKIPTGEVTLLPSIMQLRFKHQAFSPVDVRIHIVDDEVGRALVVEYMHAPITTKIFFDAVFPFTIQGWKTTENGVPTSIGKLKKQLRAPYWQMNGNAYLHQRDSLGLTKTF